MLSAIDISHSFDYPLFDTISLDLCPSESTAILGVSGSGKSTLLHILSSFLAPKSGTVIYNGKNIYELSEKELVELRKREFGIIFQSHYLFRGFSAQENLLLSSLLTHQPVDEDLAETFGVKHVLSQPIGELSGGQQQRISIVRVLNKKPRIIFADEPTGNLDKENAAQVMQTIFDDLKKNQSSMLCVTHDEELASLCNNVFKLENKRLDRLQ